MPDLPFISIVVPVYNEEESLAEFLREVRTVMSVLTEEYEIIFAADPCTDRTVEVLKEANAKDPRIKALLFSRRFGQPSATIAGLHHSRGQITIVIDCDMQDPPSLIPEMIEYWKKGFKVIIPQRRSRAGEHPVKILIAYIGYWFINKISTVPIPRNTGDFRLLDRRVVDELCKLNESHGFLRGLVGVVGFKTYLMPFDRQSRVAGKGKYNKITGSLRIGFNGIVAFSDYLLNMLVVLGFAMSVLSVIASVLVIYVKIAGLYDFAPGLTTAVLLILMMNGLQFIGMGILGAYIGRIYDESKRRPRFIVEEAIGIDSTGRAEDFERGGRTSDAFRHESGKSNRSTQPIAPAERAK